MLPTKRHAEKSGRENDEMAMLGLYQAIESRLPGVPNKIIQVVSSRSGEGTSTIVRQLAEVIAVNLCKSVLILEACWRNPTQRLFYKIEPDCFWDEIVMRGGSPERALHRVGQSNIFISPISTLARPLPNLFELAVTGNFLGALRERFDFALIDSPAFTTSAEGGILARNVDGTVLVVEAEKTRWPVVSEVKNRIDNEGGNLLGVALNKRRYHIPGFIYKHM